MYYVTAAEIVELFRIKPAARIAVVYGNHVISRDEISRAVERCGLDLGNKKPGYTWMETRYGGAIYGIRYGEMMAGRRLDAIFADVTCMDDGNKSVRNALQLREYMDHLRCRIKPSALDHEYGRSITSGDDELYGELYLKPWFIRVW